MRQSSAIRQKSIRNGRDKYPADGNVPRYVRKVSGKRYVAPDVPGCVTPATRPCGRPAAQRIRCRYWALELLRRPRAIAGKIGPYRCGCRWCIFSGYRESFVFRAKADYRRERSAKLQHREQQDRLDREVLRVNAHVTPKLICEAIMPQIGINTMACRNSL
jgi:hypothetical protein